MKITIVADKLTPAITDYVTKKVNMLEKFIDTSGDKEALARVELGKETKHHQKGDIYVAEIHLSYRKEKYNIKAKAADLYAAIDEAKDELAREISAEKKKRTTKAKAGGRVIKKILHGQV